MYITYHRTSLLPLLNPFFDSFFLKKKILFKRLVISVMTRHPPKKYIYITFPILAPREPRSTYTVMYSIIYPYGLLTLSLFFPFCISISPIPRSFFFSSSFGPFRQTLPFLVLRHAWLGINKSWPNSASSSLFVTSLPSKLFFLL